MEKPSVKVFYNQGLCESDFCEILYGIEEEGIPFELWGGPSSDATRMAYEAAQSSRLGVGVGVDAGEAVLHFEKLAPEQPLASVQVRDAAKCRALGANAARLVKRLPLKGF